MNEVKTPDVRVAIVRRMKSKGQSYKWLAKTTKIPYDTLYSCLKKRLFSLSEENLKKINAALETDFIL